MARDPEPARRALIAAGERLFAERGIRGVSLREINTAAGQRNASALHYHFGSREGLLRAILAQYLEVIRDRRLALIDELGAGTRSVDVRSAVRVLIEPLTVPLEYGRSGRAFAQILPQVLIDPKRPPAEVTEILGDTAREQAHELLAPYCASLPELLARERLAVLQLQVVHSVADRARVEARPQAGWPLQPLPFFVANLVDMFVAALLGPPSPATMDALGAVDGKPRRRPSRGRRTSGDR